MKSIKCAIGATLLAPVFFGAVGAIILGIMWLAKTYATDKIITIGFYCLAFFPFFVIIWGSIYEFCVRHNSKNN
jgi:ABC-type dipeptide/oligopeptide/nickel transport system permease component